MKIGISDYVNQVDNVFLFIVIISIIILVGVTVTMIYFVIKYNRKRHPIAENIEGNTMLEITWIAIPTILVVAMFYFGYTSFRTMRTIPKNAVVIHVQGQMWKWSFKYANGKKYDTLYVPVGKTIKLLLTSIDVNHAFYIPAFRLKEDVVPGRENYLAFTPDKVGTYDIACAEYCGLKHSYMYNKIHVIPQEEFKKWVNEKEVIK
ncbi:MAG: cytochrome c oxidase subunit II [Ignavibacteriales bacterium]|nr:cytochrome c oxidase subunit II [Ignavibacteriales bacterium]